MRKVVETPAVDGCIHSCLALSQTFTSVSITQYDVFISAEERDHLRLKFNAFKLSVKKNNI